MTWCGGTPPSALKPGSDYERTLYRGSGRMEGALASVIGGLAIAR